MSGYIPFVGHPRAVFFAAAVGHERLRYVVICLQHGPFVCSCPDATVD